MWSSHNRWAGQWLWLCTTVLACTLSLSPLSLQKINLIKTEIFFKEISIDIEIPLVAWDFDEYEFGVAEKSFSLVLKLPKNPPGLPYGLLGKFSNRLGNAASGGGRSGIVSYGAVGLGESFLRTSLFS